MHPISFPGRTARPAAPVVSGRSVTAQLRRARSGAPLRISSGRGTPSSGKRLGGVQQRQSTTVSFARHRPVHESAGKPEHLLDAAFPVSIRHAEGKAGPLAAYPLFDEHSDLTAGLNLALRILRAGFPISSTPREVHSTNFCGSPRVSR